MLGARARSPPACLSGTDLRVLRAIPGRPDNPNAESSAQAVLLRPVGAGSAASPGRAGRGSLFARRALAACMLVAGLSLGCALAHAETKLAAAGRQASRAVPARLRMRLRGGGEQADAATGLTEAQANALLEGAEEDESGPAAILTILRDYGGSANVVRLGCQRIAAAFTDAGRNVTECEALRTAYASAGGAMCVLETLKAHSSKGDPLVIAAVCAALRQLLAGPPNHAAEGDELWDQDCAATPIRVQCGRAGAAQMAIEVMTSYAAAAQHAAAEQDAAAVQVMCVMCVMCVRMCVRGAGASGSACAPPNVPMPNVPVTMPRSVPMTMTRKSSTTLSASLRLGVGGSASTRSS